MGQGEREEDEAGKASWISLKGTPKRLSFLKIMEEMPKVVDWTWSHLSFKESPEVVAMGDQDQGMKTLDLFSQHQGCLPSSSQAASRG